MCCSNTHIPQTTAKTNCFYPLTSARPFHMRDTQSFGTRECKCSFFFFFERDPSLPSPRWRGRKITGEALAAELVSQPCSEGCSSPLLRGLPREGSSLTPLSRRCAFSNSATHFAKRARVLFFVLFSLSFVYFFYSWWICWLSARTSRMCSIQCWSSLPSLFNMSSLLLLLLPVGRTVRCQRVSPPSLSLSTIFILKFNISFC